VNRTLVLLRCASERFPAPGAKLTLDVREAGVVTSSGFSPRLNRGIALAYVVRQVAEAPAPLQAGGIELTIAPSLAPDTQP
jgi:glycine cleavage system aminomethyltransferase T